jgi:uncharacterized membrane protein (DUF485 family)
MLTRREEEALMPQDPDDALEALARKRWRVAASLTAAMLVAYFGFILLVAFDKPLMGRILTPGLSLGILLGALVIVVAWALTGIYVLWANGSYDRAVHRLKQR